MTSSMYDVAVIGAGPAGAGAAALLAERGVRTLLLERERFPRYKACGGGVDGIAVQALAAMNIDPAPLREDAATDLCVTSGGRHAALYRFEQPFALMTMRSRLDALIAAAAVDRGAEFHDADPVESVSEVGSHIEIVTRSNSYEAKLLIGADGVYSRVARTFGLNRDPILYVLTAAEVEVDAETHDQWAGRSWIDVSVWPLGYGWVFPKRSHLSIGAGVPKSKAKQLMARFQRVLERVGGANCRVLQRKSHMLGFRRRLAPISSDRVLVVGDAAGLVDPNTGGGIGWALRSADLAATSVMSYLGGETDTLRGYTQLVDRVLEPELQAARVLRNMIVLRLILSRGRATHDQKLWNQIIRIIRGEERYSAWYAQSRLANWLAWTEAIPL